MNDCTKCSHKNNEEQKTVPYIVHESEIAKAERREKRLLFAVIVSVSSMLLSNLAWLIAWVA